MVATGETVGLAEWIIDDTCFVLLILSHSTNLLSSVTVQIITRTTRLVGKVEKDTLRAVLEVDPI